MVSTVGTVNVSATGTMLATPHRVLVRGASLRRRAISRMLHVLGSRFRSGRWFRLQLNCLQFAVKTALCYEL